MKKIISILIFAILILTLSSCGGAKNGGAEQREVTVVLDWTPNTNHTGLYVADKLGYYAAEGLKINIVQPPEDGAYSLVAAGKAELCVGFQETLAAALTAEQPLGITAVAAIVDHNTSGIISAKDKGIDSFKKLENHSYATWETPLEKEVIAAVMEKQGGDVGRVNFIPSTVTDVMTALTTDIDSVWVYEAWDVAAARVAGFDYSFLKFADVLPALDYYTPVLVAGDGFMKSEPETLRKFLAATAKGYEYAISNPEEAADILTGAVPELSGELIRSSQEYLSTAYKAEKPDWGTIDAKRWSDFYAWAYEKGVISENLGEKGFTNEFLPKK